MDFYLLSRKTHNICCCRPLPFFSTFGVNNLVLILKNCNNKFWFNIVHWHFFFKFGAYHLVLVLKFCIQFPMLFTCHNMGQYDTNEAVAKNIKTARTKKIHFVYHVSVTEMSRHQFRLIISLFLLASTHSPLNSNMSRLQFMAA